MKCLGETKYKTYEHPMYKQIKCMNCNWLSSYCLDCHRLHSNDINHGLLNLKPDKQNKKLLHIEYICNDCLK